MIRSIHYNDDFIKSLRHVILSENHQGSLLIITSTDPVGTPQECVTMFLISHTMSYDHIVTFFEVLSGGNLIVTESQLHV